MTVRIAIPDSPYMTSGCGEQQVRTYERLTVDGQQYWVASDVPNRGDYVYGGGGPGSQGFGGRRMQFRLANGAVDDVIGPWHTGLRGYPGVSDRHWSWCALGRAIDYGRSGRLFGDAIVDPVFVDPAEGCVHEFDRADALAALYARSLGAEIVGVVITAGGGHSIRATPETTRASTAVDLARQPDLEYWRTPRATMPGVCVTAAVVAANVPTAR